MPTYSHRCDSCEHEFELDYSIKADPPKTCPECQKDTVRRMISGGGISRMELTGAEFLAKLPEDTRKIMGNIGSKESTFANMVGESAYHEYAKKPYHDKKRR